MSHESRTQCILEFMFSKNRSSYMLFICFGHKHFNSSVKYHTFLVFIAQISSTKALWEMNKSSDWIIFVICIYMQIMFLSKFVSNISNLNNELNKIHGNFLLSNSFLGITISQSNLKRLKITCAKCIYHPYP
jgi:hypothetical protein